MVKLKPTILLTRPLTNDVEERLQQDFHVLLCEKHSGLPASEIKTLVGKADGLCPTVADRIDSDILESAGDRLKIIANFGVGYDNVNVRKASELGIVVTNTPGVLTAATADIAMTLLLMTSRRAGEGERLCRSGAWSGWNPLQLLGQHVSGKTLGLVGFGRIAQAVAQRAYNGFGMRILVQTRSVVSPEILQRFNARQCGDLEELLGESDFVSLHCPGTPETHHLINSQTLSFMRQSAVLINTARGNVVDEQALAEALERGVIAGAGLDVYEHEPTISAGLPGLENIVLLPHLGSATNETRSAMGHRMVDNLVAYFSGKEPRDRVA